MTPGDKKTQIISSKPANKKTIPKTSTKKNIIFKNLYTGGLYLKVLEPESDPHIIIMSLSLSLFTAIEYFFQPAF